MGGGTGTGMGVGDDVLDTRDDASSSLFSVDDDDEDDDDEVVVVPVVEVLSVIGAGTGATEAADASLGRTLLKNSIRALAVRSSSMPCAVP